MDSLVQKAFPEFLQAIPDAIVGVDNSGIIRFVNTHAEEMFGYERDEMVGKPVEMLVPERFHTVHPHHRAIYFANPVKRPMGAGLALSAIKKDGVEFPCDISLSAITLDNQALTLAAVRDMTERKRYEALFVTQLSGHVSELTKAVHSLTDEFVKEKQNQVDRETNRDKQRRRDLIKIAVGLLLTAVVAVAFVVVFTKINQNSDLIKSNNRTQCQAVNDANKTLHDLFAPFLKPNPDPTFEAMTPAEKRAVKERNEMQQSGLDAFVAELNRRTAPKDCDQDSDNG